MAESVVPSSSDEGESAAGLFLGMIPGSLVAAIAKLAATYVNEQGWYQFVTNGSS